MTSRLARAMETVLPGAELRRNIRAEKRLTLALAGLGIRLSGITPQGRTLLAQRFEGWLGDDGARPELEISLGWLDPEVRIASLGRNEEYRLTEDGALLGRASVTVGLAGSRVTAAVAADLSVAGQEIENVLRLVVARQLLQSGGLLLHAGAAVSRGQALVFPASSGTGKSTLVRELAAAGLEPLGDDMVALRPAAGGWTAWPLPFTGERTLKGRPKPLPLLAVHPLRRGDGPRLDPLGPGAAAAAIAHQTLGLALFPELAGAGLTIAARLSTSVPVEALFRRVGDSAAALLVQRHGGAG